MTKTAGSKMEPAEPRNGHYSPDQPHPPADYRLFMRNWPRARSLGPAECRAAIKRMRGDLVMAEIRAAGDITNEDLWARLKDIPANDLNEILNHLRRACKVGQDLIVAPTGITYVWTTISP